jgi:hypothetical protein
VSLIVRINTAQTLFSPPQKDELVAEEYSTEDRLRILEIILYLLLVRNGIRPEQNLTALRELLIPTDRYNTEAFERSQISRELLNALLGTSPGVRSRFASIERNDIARLEARIDQLERQPAAHAFELAVSLSSEVASLKEQLERSDKIRREITEILVALSDSESLATERFQRIIPATIYTASNAGGPRLLNFIRSILGEEDFDILDQEPPVLGSWKDKLFFRARQAVSRPEVYERLAKIERAIELANIDSVQSRVDKNLSVAVLNLTKALKNEKEGVISIGSLFAVKTSSAGHSRLAVISLTQEQMGLVKSNPAVQTDPVAFLRMFEQSARDPANDVTASYFSSTPSSSETSAFGSSPTSDRPALPPPSAHRPKRPGSGRKKKA